MLAIKGAKVGSWNTKSLTLWGDTHFEPNPDTAEAHDRGFTRSSSESDLSKCSNSTSSNSGYSYMGSWLPAGLLSASNSASGSGSCSSAHLFPAHAVLCRRRPGSDPEAGPAATDGVGSPADELSPREASAAGAVPGRSIVGASSLWIFDVRWSGRVESSSDFIVPAVDVMSYNVM